MTLGRRQFLQSSAAVVVYFSVQGCSSPSTNLSAESKKYDSRIAINADGSVDLFMGKVELGQGIGTALAQIAADELGVAVGGIRLINVDTDFSPDESYTFSSISIQQSGPKVRAAAAKARAEMTASINSSARVPNKSVGTAIERLDIPRKVFGGSVYLQDLRLPKMVHARIVRPAAERFQIKSMNVRSIEKMSGVIKLVRDNNFVAVVAEREGQARAAAAALREQIEWQLADDLVETGELYRWLRNTDERTERVFETGDIDTAADSHRTFSATYQRPYQAHASISPSAAVALFDDGQLTVWSHAQGMFPLRAAIAHTLGLAEDQVRCVHREASGCYGHNGADDAACDAAALAMQLPGTPVRLQWERADEFLWEPLGPGMHMEISAGLDQQNKISSWQFDLWSCPHASRPRGPDSAGHLLYAQQKSNPLPVPEPHSIPQPNGGSDRNSVPIYAIPNMQVNKHFVTDIRVRGSSLRGLGAYGNVFAIESFMDLLANEAGNDPFDFRISHLSDPRAKEVLTRLREESNWSNRPVQGDGVGWGMAFARFKNLSSYLGVVVQLSVDVVTGDIRLQSVIGVCDAGQIVNPNGVKAQIEGGIVQSASWTLKECYQTSSSERLSKDWNDYPILRFDEVPEVDIILIDRPEQKSLGVGETAQGPTAAAIANAVYHATKRRVFELPIGADKLR